MASEFEDAETACSLNFVQNQSKSYRACQGKKAGQHSKK